MADPIPTKKSPTNTADTAVIDKFANFTIHETHYKRLSPTRSIPASILIPKAISPSPSTRLPVAVYWHGGGLICGGRLYPDWFPIWIPAFTNTHNAILVCPDYRLLPEHSGADILSDVHDFFAWLHDSSASGFAAALPQGIFADASNVIVTGGSAGGYLAVQSALLSLPTAQHNAIKGVIAQYPMLDMRHPWYSSDYEKNISSSGPNPPKHLLQTFLDRLTGDEVVTERIPPANDEVAGGIFAQGLFPRFLGTERALYPLEVLRERADRRERVPPMWICHGREDDLVPVTGTEAFVKVWKEVLPEKEGELHINYETGAHGFDDPATLQTDWVRKGVKFVEQFWP